jgi:hypothetical protein
MPPEETIRDLQSSLPKGGKSSGKKRSTFLFLFFLIFFVLIGIFYYFLTNWSNEAVVSPPNNQGLTDAKTGEPIPQEEIDRITAVQKAEKETVVFSGNVVSVEKNIVGVKYGAGVVQLSLSADGKIVKSGTGIQEQLITVEEIKPGDFLTVVFMPGKTEDELLHNGPVPVKNKIEIFSGDRTSE